MFVVTITGFKGFQFALRRYGDQMKDMRPLWYLYEKYIASGNAVKVYVEGKVNWAPYKDPKYRERKIKQGFYAAKLMRKGHMFRAFKIPNAPGNKSVKLPLEWIYGINLSHALFAGKGGYPALHNEGSGKLPKREWAYVTAWAWYRMKVFFYRYMKSIMTNQPIKL